MLERLRRGHADQAVLVTGLRGVGKTVLLGAFAERAALVGWVPVEAEISPDAPFGPRIAQLVRRALLELAPRDRWRDRLRRAAGVLQSFSITVSIGRLGDGHDRRRSHRRNGRQRGARGGSHRRAARPGRGGARAGHRRGLPLRRGPVPDARGVRGPDPRAAQARAAAAARHVAGRRTSASASSGRGGEVLRRAPLPVPSTRSARRAGCDRRVDRTRQRPRGDVRRTSRGCCRRVHGGVSLLHPGVRQGLVGPGGGVADHARSRRSRRRPSSRRVWTRASSRSGSSGRASRSSGTCGPWRSWVPNRSGPATSRAWPADRRRRSASSGPGLIDKGLLYSPSYGLRGVHGPAVRSVPAAVVSRSPALSQRRRIFSEVSIWMTLPSCSTITTLP